jgi:hypothetical protein
MVSTGLPITAVKVYVFAGGTIVDASMQLIAAWVPFELEN